MTTSSDSKKPNYRPSLNVGLIQTNLDAKTAWGQGVSPRMSSLEQDNAWQEIRWAFRTLANSDPKPDLILIPELSLPRGRIGNVRAMASALGSIVIAGVDYQLDGASKLVRNQAIVIVPRKWNGGRGRGTAVTVVEKTFPAAEEERLLKSAGWGFRRNPTLWLFRSSEIGDLGVSICFDLMDLERAILYHGRVHHMLVIAYNRDTDSFFHIAEALARVMYCNVLVCNTGYFGGSVAVSPYYEPWRHTVYRHNGGRMLATQVISLPVDSLNEAQLGHPQKGPDPCVKQLFKALPSGWPRTTARRPLNLRRVALD